MFYDGVTLNLVKGSRDLAKGWVVLVVDDELDHLKLAAKVLDFIGATVIAVQSADEALEMLQMLRPTFVLLDLAMPKHDGWWTLQHIRANPKTAKVPVLALTAHATEKHKARAQEAGFNGYIDKPFRISTLLNEIQQTLGAKAS